MHSKLFDDLKALSRSENSGQLSSEDKPNFSENWSPLTKKIAEFYRIIIWCDTLYQLTHLECIFAWEISDLLLLN